MTQRPAEAAEQPAEHPVEGSARGLLYFTDGTLAYAGRFVHDPEQVVHTHSFVEVVLVTGGEGVHQSPAGSQRVSAGDVILLRPGVWHGYEDCRRLELHNCCFSAELLRRELAWTREDPLLAYLLWTGPLSMQRRGMLTTRLDPRALEACVSHLHALNRLWLEPLALHRGDVIGRLALFLGGLARAVAKDHEWPATTAGPTHPAVAQAIRLLEARPAHPWTLTELAGELHLAPRYLVRIFKSATGLPPIAYLARRRVETAAALLLGTTQPVTQIARAVGWPDQNHFARRFKSHFGLSATTYRTRFGPTHAQLHTMPTGAAALREDAVRSVSYPLE